MGSMRLFIAFAFMATVAAPAHGQTLACIDPPSATPSEAACRIAVDSLQKTQLIILQLRGPDGKPVKNTPVTFVASGGSMPDADTTDILGYVQVTWSGPVTQEPVVVTASARVDGMTTRREIRIAHGEPTAVAHIKNVAPTGGHSAFAGHYLNHDIEVQIEADPETCNRTRVIFQYLSVGSGGTPQPQEYKAPALWSELDPGRFGCAAQLRWLLSPAVGDQTLRAWIVRDSTFSVPMNPEGAQLYLRPRVVHAVAHAAPAVLAGLALIDSANGGSIPTLVGVDLPFPTLADLLKHAQMEGAGQFVDHVRIFAGTEVNTNGRVGKSIYLGLEPLVLLLGPRVADLPVAFATGRRLGAGRNRWFAAGFVNASNLAAAVLKALGIS